MLWGEGLCVPWLGVNEWQCRGHCFAMMTREEKKHNVLHGAGEYFPWAYVLVAVEVCGGDLSLQQQW